MRALSKAGVRVPEDVSVVGFDDMPICQLIYPALSTMAVPKASRCVRLLCGVSCPSSRMTPKGSRFASACCPSSSPGESVTKLSARSEPPHRTHICREALVDRLIGAPRRGSPSRRARLPRRRGRTCGGAPRRDLTPRRRRARPPCAPARGIARPGPRRRLRPGRPMMECSSHVTTRPGPGCGPRDEVGIEGA